MNTKLSKNIRTHIIYVKEGDGTKELHITQEQYNLIREDIENLKANDFYKFTDIDTGKILFDGQKRDILRFKEKEITGNNNFIVICDYGNRHPLINGKIECDCQKNYGYLGLELRMFVYNKYKVIYPQDITSEMRKEFYLEKNKKV